MAKSTLAVKRKKKVRSGPKSFDTKYLGDEPTWTDVEVTSMDMLKAYNWYNYFYNQKDALKLLFDNYPRNKKEVAQLRKVSDKISPTVCYQARMVANGCKMPSESQEFFNDKIEGYLKLAKKVVSEIKKQEKRKAPVVSIQDRIREQISEYIAELENEIDIFTENKYKSEFDMYAWLRSKEVKSQQANAIADHYEPLLSELEEVKSKSDEQLTEGYSNMKPRGVTRFIDFVRMIVDDARKQSQNQKTVRKTRAKKPASLQKQIAKVQYQKDAAEFKLVSINPADIIGANQLWTFNTKYRLLTRYDALGPAGFSIKGTTLQGYDEENSVRKKLRKPDQILPRVLTGGKRVMNKVMDEINTKEASMNGRLNKETILLKVIK